MLERFFPNEYRKKVADIDIKNLVRLGIKGVLVDIDNTLVDYDQNIDPETFEWIENIKKEGIIFYLLSNNNKERVDSVGNIFDVKGIYHAGKPQRRGIISAINELNLKNSELAIIGDQIFTDVYGGNRLNIYTILVEQMSPKDPILTIWKRPFERLVVKLYVRDNGKSSKKRDKWKLSSAISKKVQ